MLEEPRPYPWSKGLGAFREQHEVGYSGRSKLRSFYLCRHRATRNFLCISLRLARSDQKTLGRQFFRKARLFDRQAHLGQRRTCGPDALQNRPVAANADISTTVMSRPAVNNFRIIFARMA